MEMRSMLVFETERLLLEPLSQSDWDNYLVHLNMSDEYYFQYGYEDKEELLELIQEPDPGVVYYSVKNRASEEMIGYVGITPEVDEYPDNNLEFYIFEEFRRKGYSFEAIHVFIDEYLKGNITKNIPQEVVAETLIENKPAIELLKKLGFVDEAIGLKISMEESVDKSTVIGIRRYIFRNQE